MPLYRPFGQAGGVDHAAKPRMGMDKAAILCGDGEVILARPHMKHHHVTGGGPAIGWHETAGTREAGERLQLAHFQRIRDGQPCGISRLGQGRRQHSYAIEPGGRIASMHPKPRANQCFGGLGQRGARRGCRSHDGNP